MFLALQGETVGDAGVETNPIHQSSSSSSSMTSSCGRCSSFSPRLSSAMGAPLPAAAAAGEYLCPSPEQLPEAADQSCGCLLSLPSQKPHRSSDPAWAAIRRLGHPVGPRDFKLIRRLGSGDIGTVYLCSLREDPGNGPLTSSSSAYFAMKVVDRRELAKKKKLGRAEAERRVLAALDHPFLPTLYAGFDAPPHFSCVVMEFCSGGDLHTLRHRLPSKCFPLSAVRFYGAEVLLAMEYLHMLGIVYRDLKPENVLIRSDGHIMLSDFDLSLESTASPAVRFSPDRCGASSSPIPTCASCSDDEDDGRHRPSCLPGRRLFRQLVKKPWKKTKGPAASTMTRSRSTRSCSSSTSTVFVAEPVEARSSSFVGTHEYVAPEVAAGGAHGAAVDWWAYGVFLYELAYGRTPFVGATNAATLRNVVRSPLAFPAHSPVVDPRLRGLISALLEKDPTRRLGSALGAAEVKAHPFFVGLNFALLRSQRPPVVPGAPQPARSRSCREQRRGRVEPDRSSFDLFF